MTEQILPGERQDAVDHAVHGPEHAGPQEPAAEEGEHDEVGADQEEDVDRGDGPALEARHHDEDPGGRDEHRAGEHEAERGEELAAEGGELLHV